MKLFMLFITALLSLTAKAQHHQDHPSVHGMLMAGKSKIYLSHLPMFHTPHDYQVILEVQLNQKAEAAYQAALRSSPEKVYTLVPESFVLPEMIKNPKPFTAKIYQGHFERGGKQIAGGVAVNIKKVIYFKKFDASEAKPQEASYLLFGNENEQFLAHSITTKPDFDQILKVKVASETVNAEGVMNLKFKSLANTEPLEVGIHNGILSPLSLPVPVEVQSELYLEFGDLSD